MKKKTFSHKSIPFKEKEKKITKENILNTASFPFSYNKKWFVYAGIIALGGFLIYSPILFFGFVGLDDIGFIVDDQTYFSNIGNLFKGFYFSYSLDYHRPMLFSSFIIDAQIGKTEPFIYHFSNIIYHLVACILLFQLLCLLKYDVFLSFLTTLLFTVHPLFVQAVAWIFGRNDTLLAVFILGSVNSFVSYTYKKHWRFFIMHILCLWAAFFTKESAFVLPFVLAAYLYFFFSHLRFHPEVKKNILLLCFSFISAIIWYYTRKKVLEGGVLEGTKIELVIGFDAIIHNLPIFLEAPSKFFFPFPLSVWAYFSPFHSILGLVLYVGIFVFFFKNLSKKERITTKTILWSLFWFIAFLFPATLFISTDGKLSDYLEHRFYIPCMSFVFFLNECLSLHFFQKFRNILIKMLIGITVLFGGLNIFHSHNFKNSESFWISAVQSEPHSHHAWKSLGLQYKDNGNFDKAIEVWQQSLILQPNQPDILSDMGFILLKKEQFKEAKVCFLKGIKANPHQWQAFYNLALLYEKIGKDDSAIWCYQNVIEKNPQSWRAMTNAGLLYRKQQRHDLAKKYFLKSVEINPEQWDTYFNLGATAENTGQLDSAKAFYTKSFQLNPKQPEAPLGLGTIAYFEKQYSEAEYWWQKCIEVNDNYTNAYINLVLLYLGQQRVEEARKYSDILKTKGVDITQNYPVLQ
ncbi:MAG: tetratricopeptide repeat protein [Chitinophagaceae bacterium]|nr:tetratricopeptide repeat protein [Chitinophagaceae bacterium]